MAHEIISCESWRAFRDRIAFELFDGKPFQRGVYLFRGHALQGFLWLRRLIAGTRDLAARKCGYLNNF